MGLFGESVSLLFNNVHCPQHARRGGRSASRTRAVFHDVSSARFRCRIPYLGIPYFQSINPLFQNYLRASIPPVLLIACPP